MKTYTLEQYYETFGYDEHPDGRIGGWAKQGKPFCPCVSAIVISERKAAWKSCPRCLGYGISPIPWSEVR